MPVNIPLEAINQKYLREVSLFEKTGIYSR